MPPGWRLLAAARDLPCYVLGHPAQGLILLDLAPYGSPGIEARLGRTMATAGLRRADAVGPTAWYVRIEPENMPRFGPLLADALISTPPPPAGAEGWLPPLEAALRHDRAWSPLSLPRRPRPPMLVVGSLAAAALLALMVWQGRRAAPPATGAPMPSPPVEARIASPASAPALEMPAAMPALPVPGAQQSRP